MEIPRHWRTTHQRMRLEGEICPHCEIKIFPPRDICNNCGENTKEKYLFSGKGTIYSHTENSVIIELTEGPLITSQLTDVGDTKIEIGMPVEMVTRKFRVDGDPDTGQIIYSYKFRPLINPS